MLSLSLSLSLSLFSRSDVCENVLYREREAGYGPSDHAQIELAYWAIYSMIGLGTAFAAFFILVGVEVLLAIRFGTVLKLMEVSSPAICRCV